MTKFLFKPLLFIVLFSSFLFAADLFIGARVGLNLSRISGDDVDGEEYITPLPGVTGGIFSRFRFTDFFAVQPELFYSAKGVKWKYDRSEDSGDDEAKDISRIHYVEIPVNLVFSLPFEKKINPYIYGGAAAAFFLGATKTVTINNTEVLNESRNEGARNYDIGVDFGGGFYLSIKRGDIVLDVKYTLGLLTADDEGYEEVRNRALSLSAGYSFTLGDRGGRK